MQEFMLLFRNLAPAEAFSSSPEEMEKSIPLWKNWIKGIAEEGRFVSTAPLEREGIFLTKENQTDGPYAEVKEFVLGYLVFKAKDMNEALETAKGCPMISDDHGSVEVRKVAPFSMG
ncbi:MAG: YciI family protein [Bacteroidota bacterium]